MLQEYFETIEDPRQQHKVKHNLLEIVIMTICAVIAECEAWYQVAGYSQEKESWICEKLGLRLENGIASHDTFERIFSIIELKELENSFVPLMNPMRLRRYRNCWIYWDLKTAS